jgi:type III secretory pathway component EscV
MAQYRSKCLNQQNQLFLECLIQSHIYLFVPGLRTINLEITMKNLKLAHILHPIHTYLQYPALPVLDHLSLVRQSLKMPSTRKTLLQQESGIIEVLVGPIPALLPPP